MFFLLTNIFLVYPKDANAVFEYQRYFVDFLSIRTNRCLSIW